jgi:nucleoside-diphosphate-sugar epimerase
LPRGEVAGGAFNFASGVETSVLDMVRAVGDTIGGTLPEPRVLGVAKNEIREQRLSIEKAKRVLDWKPRVTLREGLRETVGWYRGFLRGRD